MISIVNDIGIDDVGWFFYPYKWFAKVLKITRGGGPYSLFGEIIASVNGGLNVLKSPVE